MNTNIKFKTILDSLALKSQAGTEKPNQETITAENAERNVPVLPLFHFFRAFRGLYTFLRLAKDGCALIHPLSKFKNLCYW